MSFKTRTRLKLKRSTQSIPNAAIIVPFVRFLRDADLRTVFLAALLRLFFVFECLFSAVFFDTVFFADFGLVCFSGIAQSIKTVPLDVKRLIRAEGMLLKGYRSNCIGYFLRDVHVPSAKAPHFDAETIEGCGRLPFL